MLVQIGLECKSFVTSYAYKRFGVGVGLDVSTQIRLVGKSLVANVTTKWFFSYEKKKKKSVPCLSFYNQEMQHTGPKSLYSTVLFFKEQPFLDQCDAV